MRRLVLWSFSIVAAFDLRLAAAAPPSTTRVPVTPSVMALAERVELNPARDRGRFVAELIRRVYAPPSSRTVPLLLEPGTREELRADPVRVELPLTPEVWGRAVFKTRLSAEQVLVSILADRRAALVCRGLLAADDETLEYYAEHPALLTFAYEHAAGAFAAFAGSVRVHGGRIAFHGGAPAQALWESALQVRADDPEAFIRSLLFEPEARPGYLWDVLAAASPESRAFALGLWIEDEPLRNRRFQALLLAARSAYHEWHVNELPFGRPLNDLAILLLRLRADARGTPAPPAERRFWAEAFDTSAEGPADSLPSSHTKVDAAWLVQAITGDMYARGDKLEALAFGQRVFAARPESEHQAAASVVREMTTRRMLLLGLERVGVTDPAIYVAALRQARAAAGGGADRFWTLAQLQGALALVVRMHATATVGNAEAERLVRALMAIPLVDGEFHGGLLAWFDDVLVPLLPRALTLHGRVVAGLAGAPTAGSPEVEWEGQKYRLDLAYAERRRIEEIQSHQDGPDLEAAFAVARLGQRARAAASADAGHALAAEAQEVLASYGLMFVRPPNNVFAPGVPVPRDGREWLARAAEELERGARTGDVRRVTRTGESLVQMGDMELGHALLSLVYAVHLGDPGGPALLGGNVALRHDFGFARSGGEGHSRGPWAMPRQDFQPGVPWHVVGALVGLDIGLAPLSLHRLSMDTLPTPPKLQSIEREAFAVNVAVLNPRALTDRDRDRIVAAISSGRARVRQATTDAEAFEKLEQELAFDGWRARSLRWMLQNEPGSVENQFSLAELVRLGDAGAALDAWGVSGLLSYGCACPRFPAVHAWRVLAGRTQQAMMAAATVDMNLEMAQRLSSMRLPAALLPSLLATAMQDYVDRVDSSDPNDREPLLSYPRALGRNALADFVAATATLDGPLVSVDLDGTEP